MADDAKTRSEVMHQAAKQDWERQLSQKNDDQEDHRRALSKKVWSQRVLVFISVLSSSKSPKCHSAPCISPLPFSSAVREGTSCREYLKSR